MCIMVSIQYVVIKNNIYHLVWPLKGVMNFQSKKTISMMVLLLTVTHKNSILRANNKVCTLNNHAAKELQGLFFSLLLQEVYVSFYINRSKICADESAHAASLGKISSGSWSPLEQFPVCVRRLEWRPFKLLPWNAKYPKPG